MPQEKNLPFKECIACDIQNHRLAEVLDHADGSVTLSKLADDAKDKLGISDEKTITLADGDIALGTNNSAGRKAYYIAGIDIVNKKIYLSATQNIPPSYNYTKTNPGWAVDKSFTAPAYAVGDEFSIIWNSHYNFADKIAKIENNVITWSGDFYPPSPSTDSGDDAFTFHVPSKPNIGIIELGINAFVAGQDNKANGRGTTICGRNIIGSGNYGALFGRNHKGGYGVLVGGNGNTITGNNAFGVGGNNNSDTQTSGIIGSKNTLKKSAVNDGGNTLVIGLENNVNARQSLISGLKNEVYNAHESAVIGHINKVKDGFHVIVLGRNNNVTGDQNFVLGQSLQTGEGAWQQTILGQANIPDPEARFIIGNGYDDIGPQNAMVIKKDGRTIFTGSVQATSFVDAEGNEYVSKKYVDEQIAALKKQLGVG